MSYRIPGAEMAVMADNYEFLEAGRATIQWQPTQLQNISFEKWHLAQMICAHVGAGCPVTLFIEYTLRELSASYAALANQPKQEIHNEAEDTVDFSEAADQVQNTEDQYAELRELCDKLHDAQIYDDSID